MLIDQELAQITIRKTLNAFSDKFTSLDNFKNIKTMYVINDENFEDVKANLSNLSESDVLTISVHQERNYPVDTGQETDRG
jgi:hypothetical protein